MYNKSFKETLNLEISTELPVNRSFYDMLEETVPSLVSRAWSG